MKTTVIKKHSIIRYLTIGLLSGVLFTACSKNEEKPKDEKSGEEITATLQFSDGKTVDFSFAHQKDDLIKPSLNGPNGNDHYKLRLRGEKPIDGTTYTINIYVTMPENALGDYKFGRAWQWHDEGFVTEIHVGVTDMDNPLNLKQYVSTPPDVDNTNSKGVTITSLSEDHVQGTFSGKAAYTKSDIVTITNGKFDIDIERGSWED